MNELEAKVRALTQRVRELEHQNRELVRGKGKAFDEWAYAKFSGDGLDSGERDYFLQHRDTIESALGNALRNVVGAEDGERSADPVRHMADLMMKRRRGSSASAPSKPIASSAPSPVVVPPTVLALGTPRKMDETEDNEDDGSQPDRQNSAKPAKVERDLRGMIMSIMERHAKSNLHRSMSPASTGRHTPAEAEADEFEASLSDGTVGVSASSGVATPSAMGQSTPGSASPAGDMLQPVTHSTASWLGEREAFDFKEVVAEALLEPLRAMVRERQEGGASLSLSYPKLEMDFLEELSDKDEEWISVMLSKTHLLTNIAQNVAKAANRFTEMRQRSGEGKDANRAPRTDSKFFDDTSALVYGTPDVFFSGLDGFIGPPNPNLDSTVENEHCKADDSGIRVRGAQLPDANHLAHRVLVRCAGRRECLRQGLP